MEGQTALRPLIGLVSGTFNRLLLLQGMVQSFRENIPRGFPYCITLVDGGSTDGTIEWCLEQADITLIQDGKLTGAISAFTRGAFATDAQYILLANDDITFPPGSVMRAFTFLDEHARAGAVAFADNRPVPGYDRHKFKTLKMPAIVRDHSDLIRYAQVGLFRKWLGDTVDWWGANTTMRLARTYGGDNNLSAHIWANGYTVEEVPGCYIIDHVADDELRQINRAAGQVANVDDSNEYYRQWRNRVSGPIVPPVPTLPQQDSPTVRVLYLPIYEPGWPVQKQQKRGLRDALARATTPNGYRVSVYELDYLGIPKERLEDRLLSAADEFRPHLILTQLQSAEPLTKDLLVKLRSIHPRATVVNWNGDEAQGGLISPVMLNLLSHVDLQLTVNASTLPVYAQHGIKAAYWQIGYEEPGDDLPDMPAHDVVFLGSFNNPARLPLLEALKRLSDEKINVGVYTPGDSSATLYDFAKGKALYHNAKIAVGSNEYPNSAGFVSNRLFQAMSAGGCLYLQQKVAALDTYTGILPATHYVEWDSLADLIQKVQYFLNPANDLERRRIADAGTAFVRQYHSFDVRVRELFSLMKQHLGASEVPDGNAVYLRYIGRSQDEFGIRSKAHENIKYIYRPGQPLLVDRFDASWMLAEGLWELMGD